MGTSMSDSEPSVSDGKIRALLSSRIDAGDNVMKEHLEPCMRNATYISPKIQN
jgi:hypothetical protein